MKKFYNKTIMSRAFSSALRVFALLCVLLGVSSSAWGKTLSEYKNGSSSIFLIGEFNGWATSDNNFELNSSDGNLYTGSFEVNAGTYAFKIYTSDGEFYSSGTFNSGAQAEFNDSNGNMSLTATSNTGKVKLDVELYLEYGGQSKLTINQSAVVADPKYSLGGYINQADVNSYNSNYDLAKQSDGTYKGTFSFTSNHESAQWIWVIDDSGTKWGVSSDQTLNPGSTITLTQNQTSGKVKAISTTGTNYTFTFNPSNGSLTFTSGDSGSGGDDTGDCTTLYLEPTSNWNKDGARFAAYFYGGGMSEKWVDMASSSCTGLFKVAVPDASYTNVIFVRMNGATAENKWENKWNQTGDLSLAHSNNRYTISDVNGGGSWSSSNCTDKAECSGSGDDDDDPEDCNYVEIWARGKGSYTDIYCNVGSATAVSTEIQEYNGNNYATWTVTTKTAIAVSFCAGDNHGYCTNTASMEPGHRYICEFDASNWGNKDYTIVLDEPLDCAGVMTDVLLSKQPTINKTTGKATLFGYLKKTGCNPITDYGFYYCRVVDGEKCKPSSSSYKLQVDPSHQLVRSEEFSAELELEDGYTYYYRAYAIINGAPILSQETRMIGTDPCVQQACCGAPVVYTINADPEFKENMCKLHFKSLQDAVDHLKASSFRTDAYQYAEKVGSSYNLKQPVVMNVVYYDDTPLDNTSAYIYRGTTNVGKRAGDAEPKNSNLIEDINRTATNAANTLTIKAGTKTAKPWIHHIVLRNSKNIVLDSLCIYSDPVLYDGKTIGDNAIEMDINHANAGEKWNELNNVSGEGIDAGQHFFSNANILVQNCMIGSDGFTGAHISSYDGVTFKNNDFEIVAGASMDKDYGASFKLLYCKNVKFIQNNFRGDHATLMWIQEVQNMLVMNNVFWNTNKLMIDTQGDQYPAAMRLVTQFGNPINNVGFFYNTYYLAENNQTATVPSGYDFLQMTHTVSGGSGTIDVSTIKFQYNNCYSYDTDAHGRTADNYQIKDGSTVRQTGPFLGTDLSNNENFCPNNFWSQYDDDQENATSAFAFGCANNEFTNVKGQVCETTASGPASLIVKGEALNNGVKPDITFTGITLTDEEWYADRYLTAVRPKSNEAWTYGAYQSKGVINTNTIYWVGVSDKWDDRNNWEYEVRDASGKMIRQRVSCINNLSENLKVVIEEIGTVEVAGGRKWPVVPSSFNANDRRVASGVPVGEQVSAGLGTTTPTKFANTIELEYGAGLRGVENLQNDNGDMLYDNAIVHFDADRSKWLLVGHIVKPWDEKTQTYRTGLSGDYYLQHVPQVYMHQAYVDGNDIVWDKTFADLDIPVPSNEIYAINVTEFYGTSWFSAGLYNYLYNTNYSATEPHPYTFTGRFAVSEDKDANQDYYQYAVNNGKNLLNNIYPCNIDAEQIESLGLGTINVYDYMNGSFVSTSADPTADNVYIKAQNGFVFTPAAGKSTLELSEAILAEGSTRTRSNEVQLPTFSLQVDNANTTAPGASNVVVVLDEAQPDNYNSPLNTPKVFTRNEDTPEAYILSDDAGYSRLYVNGETKRIPLGIRLLKAMNITFEKVYSTDFSKVILLDTKTQKEYNLLERVYTTEQLMPGDDIVGRFFLVLEPEDENLPEDEVVTDIDEAVENTDINVYAVNGNAIRVVGVGVDLQTIYVSDMAGRTMQYEANSNLVELQLPVAQGVYMVHVIGENATKTEKVVLK